jgi:hypothetical protein
MLGISTGLPIARDFHRIAKNQNQGIPQDCQNNDVLRIAKMLGISSGLPIAREFHRIAKMRIREFHRIAKKMMCLGLPKC